MGRIGERLVGLRKEKGMSQEELASHLKVTRQAISNWERDKTEPDLEMLSRLADLLGKDVDYLLGRVAEEKKEVPITLNKLKYLHWLNVLIVVGYCLFILVSPNYSFSSELIYLFVLLSGETVVYFIYTYAIKTGDYTMISGYDRKLKYHYPVLNRMLYMIVLSWSLTTIVFMMIHIIMMFMSIEEGWLTRLLIVLYVIHCVSLVFIIESKYRDQMLIDYQDQEESKIGIWIAGGFAALAILLVVTMIITMTVFEIHNNTIEAAKLCLFIIPYLVLSIGALFFEQHRIKKAVQEQQSYRLDKLTWLVIVACLILLGAIVWTGYQTTLIFLV